MSEEERGWKRTLQRLKDEVEALNGQLKSEAAMEVRLEQLATEHAEMKADLKAFKAQILEQQKMQDRRLDSQELRLDEKQAIWEARQFC